MQGMENGGGGPVTSYGRMMTAMYIVWSVSFWTSCNVTLLQLRKNFSSVRWRETRMFSHLSLASNL